MTKKEQIEKLALEMVKDWKGRESAVIIARKVGEPSTSLVQRIAEEAIDDIQ